MDVPAPSLDTMECPYCAETIKAKAKICRYCGKELPLGKSTGGDSSNIDIENRLLCSDGSCIGVIGSDGRCTLCGKLYEKDQDNWQTEPKSGTKLIYPREKPWFKKWWIIALLVFVFLVIVTNLFKPKTSQNQGTPSITFKQEDKPISSKKDDKQITSKEEEKTASSELISFDEGKRIAYLSESAWDMLPVSGDLSKEYLLKKLELPAGWKVRGMYSNRLLAEIGWDGRIIIKEY